MFIHTQNIVLFCVFLSFTAVVSAQIACFTPNRKAGECIAITQCKSLLQVLYRPNKTEEELDLLRYSQCGTFGGIGGKATLPKVCCPDNTSTSKYSETTTNKNSVQEVKCGVAKNTTKSNGEETDITAHPWIALILYRDKSRQKYVPVCSGTIITDKFILTLAQCISGPILKKIKIGPPVKVILGDHDLSTDIDCRVQDGILICNDGPQTYTIDKFAYPKKYTLTPSFGFNDIGIVRVAETIKWTDFVKPICLPTPVILDSISREVAAPVTVVGWGTYLDEIKSQTKRVRTINIIGRDECRKTYEQLTAGEGEVIIDIDKICAGRTCDDQKYQNPGTPLMRYDVPTKTWYLIGMSSVVLNFCGIPVPPGIFTNVNPYLQWINAHTSGKVK